MARTTSPPLASAIRPSSARSPAPWSRATTSTTTPVRRRRGRGLVERRAAPVSLPSDSSSTDARPVLAGEVHGAHDGVVHVGAAGQPQRRRWRRRAPRGRWWVRRPRAPGRRRSTSPIRTSAGRRLEERRGGGPGRRMRAPAHAVAGVEREHRRPRRPGRPRPARPSPSTGFAVDRDPDAVEVRACCRGQPVGAEQDRDRAVDGHLDVVDVDAVVGAPGQRAARAGRRPAAPRRRRAQRGPDACVIAGTPAGRRPPGRRARCARPAGRGTAGRSPVARRPPERRALLVVARRSSRTGRRPGG